MSKSVISTLFFFFFLPLFLTPEPLCSPVRRSAFNTNHRIGILAFSAGPSTIMGRKVPTSWSPSLPEVQDALYKDYILDEVYTKDPPGAIDHTPETRSEVTRPYSTPSQVTISGGDEKQSRLSRREPARPYAGREITDQSDNRFAERTSLQVDLNSGSSYDEKLANIGHENHNKVRDEGLSNGRCGTRDNCMPRPSHNLHEDEKDVATNGETFFNRSPGVYHVAKLSMLKKKDSIQDLDSYTPPARQTNGCQFR